MEGIKGFKVFDHDWTCRGFKYEVGQIYEEDLLPVCCVRGLHFCKELNDCFSYYDFDPDNKVAKVVALGEIDEESDNTKCCTNKIYIAEEITWEEVIRMVNIGKENSGLCNTGDCNTGSRNTGSRNTGSWNTGDRNEGDFNTGKLNTGDCNTGYQNTGNWNTGDRNTGNWNTWNRNAGDFNTGSWNTGARNAGDQNTGSRNTGDCNTGSWNAWNRNAGDFNTGSWNTGDRNAGDQNTGNWNTGNRNAGSLNTGNWNTGSWNTGNRNTGNRNTGDWNLSSFNAGCFNTEEHKISLFNRPSDWTYRDWLYSDARNLLNRIPKNVVEWIYDPEMTDEEKAANPTYKTTGGFLKILDESECAQKWWDGLSEANKNTIMDIPNFDAAIFEQITGIKAE